MTRNYGLKFDTPDPEHYVFGSGKIPMEVIEEDGDWTPSLPTKEFQNLNGVEPYACVSFTILNCVETLIFKKYGLVRNYSDRFLAAVSGTKEGGNSPHVVCEFLREVGVVPEEIFPFSQDINSFEKYYSPNPLPQELIDLAGEFRNEFDFFHDFVVSSPVAITAALKCSPLLITMYAWERLENGLYTKPTGFMDNHAIMLFSERQGEFRRIFDSYDQPNIKDIEWSSMPMVIKRFHITKKVAVVTPSAESFWSKIVNFILNLFKKS